MREKKYDVEMFYELFFFFLWQHGIKGLHYAASLVGRKEVRKRKEVVMEWRKLRVLLDLRGKYVRDRVAKVVFAVWGEKRWSHREFVVLIVSGKSVNVSRKYCPEVKSLGVGAEFCQFWGWRKVVPVCGVLNLSNSYSTGNPWSKRNRHKGSIN